MAEQAYFGISADLSIFGKAIANGISVSALVGKKEIMPSVITAKAANDYHFKTGQRK